MGSPCLVPRPGHKDFIVLHTNGLHYIAVDFCGCDHRITSRQQLLRVEWYPATVHYPQTCATFRLLELFHTVTLTGKLSAHEFYKALEHLTDNTSLNIPKVSRAIQCLAESDDSFQTRYKSFMRMIREFRHLKLMKRNGRGNIKNCLISTSSSDLTVPCPACPIPGINLQDEWEQAPKEMRYDFPPSWSYLTIF